MLSLLAPRLRVQPPAYPSRLCMPTTEGYPTLLEALCESFWNLYYDIRTVILTRFFPRYLARRKRWVRVKVWWRRLFKRLHRSWTRSATFAFNLYRVHRISQQVYLDRLERSQSLAQRGSPGSSSFLSTFLSTICSAYALSCLCPHLTTTYVKNYLRYVRCR